MATCKISEYANLAKDAAGKTVMAAREPAIATQTVTYTSSTASAAFNAETEIIRVIADAKAHFVVGAAPSADADDPYVPADTVEYFGVQSGDKIALYDGTT